MDILINTSTVLINGTKYVPFDQNISSATMEDLYTFAILLALLALACGLYTGATMANNKMFNAYLIVYGMKEASEEEKERTRRGWAELVADWKKAEEEKAGRSGNVAAMVGSQGMAEYGREIQGVVVDRAANHNVGILPGDQGNSIRLSGETLTETGNLATSAQDSGVTAPEIVHARTWR
ncbi:hypothetical protein NHQ30_008739 [Ciborinia camelliae]|nr:hypothetical protein NHQ30_008739 [Ciborinia camelliae]